MTPLPVPDGRSAYDQFWAAVETPPRPAEPTAPADVDAAVNAVLDG